MSNTIDSTGLTIKTRAEIISELENGADGVLGLLDIYGSDAQLDPNSPDGNLLQLIAQMAIDYEELIAAVYSSIDPDQADGINLDLRCAINGVTRKPGTFTTQLVAVTVSQALTIPGIDTAPDAPFAVSDANGNIFQLVAAYAFGGAGAQNLLFQAAFVGKVVVASNSLTTIATPTLGVVSVTNGTLAGTLGTEEETDYALRVRRAQSVSLPSKGFFQGLVGALLAIETVTSVLVLENITSAPDANGIPGHSIWCVVAGGTNAEVAAAIYLKRNAGCGMKGGVSVNVTQVDGSIFAVLFDRPTPQNLWITIDAAAITGPAVDADFLRTQILANISYGINQAADASAIVAFAKTIYPNASISGEGVSTDNVTYSSLLSPAAVNNQWALASARIYVNGAHG